MYECVLSLEDCIPPPTGEVSLANMAECLFSLNALSFIPFDMQRWDVRMQWKQKGRGRDR